jgi:hypothetical protein
MSCRIVSCRIVSYRVVSCRVVSYRVVSCDVVSYRVVSNRVVSYRIVSYRVVSYRVVSCDVVSCRIVSYRIVSYRIVSYRAMSQYNCFITKLIVYPRNCGTACGQAVGCTEGQQWCAGTEGNGRSSHENCSYCTEPFTLHRMRLSCNVTLRIFNERI